jgi:hypothetical protein
MGKIKLEATQGLITFEIWTIRKTPPRIKSMKYILLVTILIAGGVSAQAQEYVTLVFGNGANASYTPVNVPAGKVAEVLGASGNGNSAIYYSPASSNGATGINSNNYPFFTVGSVAVGSKYAGPGILFCSQTSGQTYSGYGLLTYRFVDNTSTTTTTPTSSVVIPTDATGPVKIVLESSTDLVTWTEANPGTYGASTTKRFFRVRAVNQ